MALELEEVVATTCAGGKSDRVMAEESAELLECQDSSSSIVRSKGTKG